MELMSSMDYKQTTAFFIIIYPNNMPRLHKYKSQSASSASILEFSLAKQLNNKSLD